MQNIEASLGQPPFRSDRLRRETGCFLAPLSRYFRSAFPQWLWRHGAGWCSTERVGKPRTGYRSSRDRHARALRGDALIRMWFSLPGGKAAGMGEAAKIAELAWRSDDYINMGCSCQKSHRWPIPDRPLMRDS